MVAGAAPPGAVGCTTTFVPLFVTAEATATRMSGVEPPG
jgi:hypothetical protein